MAIIECRECGGKVSDSAVACPHCGAPVAVAAVSASPAEPKKKRGWWKWVLGVPVGLFALLLVIGALSGPGNDGYAKKKRIEQECEKMLSDSAPGDERRMTRRICDQAIEQAKRAAK